VLLGQFSLLAAAQRLNAGAFSQNAAQGIMGLANQAGPHSDPVALQSSEKALTLQKFGADIQAEATGTWENSLRQGRRQETQRREQAIANGWIFA
jgi:hypothetical protein